VNRRWLTEITGRRWPAVTSGRRRQAVTFGSRWLAVAVGALVLMAGCGGTPTSGTTSIEPTPRTPAGAQTLTEVPPPPGQDTSCGDATASSHPLASMPIPGQMPDGSTMAAIQKREHLIAGVDQNTFLFGYRDPISGELSGFDVDIAREIAKAIFGGDDSNIDSKIEFRPMTSDQRIPLLKNNEVDVVVRTFTINCERRKEIEFSSEYYRSAQRVLVGRDSSATGLPDLGGKRVCATKGSTSIARIANATPKPVPVQVENWSDCLMLLQLGQVEAISTDDTILAGMAAQDPGTKVVGPPLSAEPYGIGVPKANTDMVQFVNGVLERLRSDGTWTTIYQKNLGVLGLPPAPPEPQYKD
jgi:polar amino acid transport system substrate-binding protein